MKLRMGLVLVVLVCLLRECETRKERKCKRGNWKQCLKEFEERVRASQCSHRQDILQGQGSFQDKLADADRLVAALEANEPATSADEPTFADALGNADQDCFQSFVNHLGKMTEKYVEMLCDGKEVSLFQSSAFLRLLFIFQLYPFARENRRAQSEIAKIESAGNAACTDSLETLKAAKLRLATAREEYILVQE